MRVRPYNAADWEMVREIYDLSKPDEMRGGVDVSAIIPLQDDRAAQALFRDSTIVVAEDGARVVGFGGHKADYISWLFVHPACRRRGVGRALLNEIVGRLQGPITLNVGLWNHAARELYGEFGFVTAREFQATFNGHDVVVLTLVRQSER
jgi:GNAT superfamily N-acetyltransferase